MSGESSYCTKAIIVLMNSCVLMNSFRLLLLWTCYVKTNFNTQKVSKSWQSYRRHTGSGKFAAVLVNEPGQRTHYAPILFGTWCQICAIIIIAFSWFSASFILTSVVTRCVLGPHYAPNSLVAPLHPPPLDAFGVWHFGSASLRLLM